MTYLNLKQGTKVIYNETLKGWRHKMHDAEIVSIPENSLFATAIIKYKDQSGSFITRLVRIQYLQLKKD